MLILSQVVDREEGQPLPSIFAPVRTIPPEIEPIGFSIQSTVPQNSEKVESNICAASPIVIACPFRQARQQWRISNRKGDTNGAVTIEVTSMKR